MSPRPSGVASYRGAAVFAAALALALTCAMPVAAHAADAAGEHPETASLGTILVQRGPWPYMRFVGTLLGGTGVRFNNPYRLATPLGDDAESVSRTAAYVDLGLAMLVGTPTKFQHGPAMRLSFAVEGIGQQVLAPSYLVCRQWKALQPCARFGVPLVLGPGANVGMELGVGVTYFVRAGLGVVAEGVGSLFYGAGTRESTYPAYPMLSAQAGLIVSFEALP